MRLPTFIVLGAAKAGTTSLHRYLSQHPEIFMPELKEANFFALEGARMDFRGPGDHDASKHSVTDLDRYKALYSPGQDFRARGDCSPLYLFANRAAMNIRRHVPCAKLIAILRHPVDRAYSQFLDQYNRSYLWRVRAPRATSAAFLDAMAMEEQRIAANWWPFWFYKSMGMYYQQLRRYFDLFPRSQIRVYLYDDLVNDAAALLRDLFSFLDVSTTFTPNLRQKHNVSGVPKHPLVASALGMGVSASRFIPRGPIHGVLKTMRKQIARYNTLPPPPLEAGIRQKLAGHFRDDLERLETLLDIDLSAWRSHAHIDDESKGVLELHPA